DQPDRYDQHGAKHEIAPQSLESLVTHVPDRLEQLADAADDVERIEAKYLENEPNQHRQQRKPEQDDERAPAQKAVQRPRLMGGFGHLWFLGQALGSNASTFHDSALPHLATTALPPAFRVGRPRRAAYPSAVC